MTMNLLEIQDQLKGMADKYLLQSIQQPTGEIPQFMVAAEMQRRKEMRDQQAQQAPETTVVDDLEQQGLAALQPPPEEGAPEQMEQGVASIPTNMPEAPQSMAGGGIVAFGEGGDIKHFSAGDLVKLQQLKDLRRTGTWNASGRAHRTLAQLNAEIAQLEAEIAAQDGKVKPELHPKGQLEVPQPEELPPLEDRIKPPPPPAPTGFDLPEFKEYTPTPLSYDYLKKLEEAQYDPLTSKPYTREGKAAERRAIEQSLGIEDTTQEQLDKLTGKEAKLVDRENRAHGISLLRAAEKMGGHVGPLISGLVAAGGAYGANIGPELEKIDALRENYAQQGDLVKTKQMDMLRAQMTGDTAAFEQSRSAVEALRTKAGEAGNAGITQINAANLSNITRKEDRDLAVWKLKEEQRGLGERAKMQTDLYSKLLGQDVKMGSFNSAQLKNIEDYIWAPGRLDKNSIHGLLLNKHGLDLSMEQLGKLPDTTRIKYIDAMRKYNEYKAEAKKKFGTIDAPSRLGGSAGGGENIINFPDLR